MKKWSKYYFMFVLVLLLVPSVQMIFKPVKVKALRGAIENTTPPEFDWKNWFDESFQSTSESWLNENFGFRPDVVRLDNQIAYSLFDEVRAKSVIIGEDLYLYEKNYLKAYYGDDFQGEDKIMARMERIKLVQDSLSKYGIEFLVVLAPGKGSFYPEYFPDDWKRDTIGKRNIDVMRQCFNDMNINYLDLNNWFLQMKDTSQYLLYPRTGIHWSVYGMYLAIDTLISTIEENANIKMPHYRWDEIELREDLDKIDRDVEIGLNLVFPIDNPAMAYPKVRVENKGAYKPKLLMVSDSYFWEMYNRGIVGQIFGESEFWFYGKKVYPNDKVITDVSQVNIRKRILDKDVVVLMSTDANLYSFDWGFSERFKNDFHHPEGGLKPEIVDENEIKKYIKKMQGSEKWMNDIRRKAEERGIPVDSMLRMDAEWLVRNARN